MKAVEYTTFLEPAYYESCQSTFTDISITFKFFLSCTVQVSERVHSKCLFLKRPKVNLTVCEKETNLA